MQVPPNQHGTVINQRCRATLIAIAQGKPFCLL